MNKSLVQSQFGPVAAKYAVSRVHAQGASLSRLVELVRPQSGWRALDIATAAGHTALALAPHVEHVTAADITPQMLTVAQGLARERGIGNVSFEEADAENMPFAGGAFDLVTCRIAPHHFSNVPRFLSEVARVLKPGGVFGLVDNIAPDANTTSGDAAELADAAEYFTAFEKLRDPSHVLCLSLAEWLRLTGAAGLAVQHHELLDKPMAFEPWAEQMRSGADNKAELERMLLEAPPALREFLRPERRDGALWFTVVEAVIVAGKPL